jgi:hypothetical protein
MKTIQEKNGQRELLTEDEFRAWAGESFNVEFLEELLLDIVNDIYSIEDFLKDVRDYDDGYDVKVGSDKDKVNRWGFNI